jgi:DNA invertase Pin-like site-specific DNA recombinase
MLTIVNDLGRRGVGVRSLAESWLDTTTSHGRLFLTVFAGMAQWERERIKERQAEGIQRAKREGRYTGSKPRFDPAEIRRLRAAGKRPHEIKAALGCSFDTITRALRSGLDRGIGGHRLADQEC